MKATINFAAYESPKCELLAYEVEGAILTESNVGASHDGYKNGGAIDF